MLSDERLIVSRDLLERRGLLPCKGKVIGPRRWPRVAQFVEDLTYKPGYEITLIFPDQATIDGLHLGPPIGSVAHLKIKCYVPDSTKYPHDLTLIQFQAAVPSLIEDYPDHLLRQWFRETLRTFELHEVDEWFRINGELVNDPHAS